MLQGIFACLPTETTLWQLQRANESHVAKPTASNGLAAAQFADRRGKELSTNHSRSNCIHSLNKNSCNIFISYSRKIEVVPSWLRWKGNPWSMLDWTSGCSAWSMLRVHGTHINVLATSWVLRPSLSLSWSAVSIVWPNKMFVVNYALWFTNCMYRGRTKNVASQRQGLDLQLGLTWLGLNWLPDCLTLPSCPAVAPCQCRVVLLCCCVTNAWLKLLPHVFKWAASQRADCCGCNLFGNFLDILFLCCTPFPMLDISCRGEQGQGEEAALLANILCFTWLGNGSLRNYVVLRMQAPPHTLVQPLPFFPTPLPHPCKYACPYSTPALSFVVVCI